MGEGGRALGRGHRGLGEAADLGAAIVIDVALHQLQAADDAGEHVVEVVGDTAGELAHGFHLLRMAQGVFGALALEHLTLQALVGGGQRLGALGHPFFQGFVEVAQGFLGLFALGFVDHEDVETIDRAVGAVARQVLHQRMPRAPVAVR